MSSWLPNRTWSVKEVETLDELASLVSGNIWTLCTGFSVEGFPQYLFLNVSTCEDGAQEYAVIKGALEKPEHEQIESFTFGWCNEARCLELIGETLAGKFDETDYVSPVTPRLEHSTQHESCRYCR